MSVFKRKTSRGETSEYHYKFMQNGKNYYGVCEGCTTEEQAREFEARLKRISKEAGGAHAVCVRKGFALVPAHFLLLCGLARNSPCHRPVNRRAHVAGNDKALHGTFNDGSKARVHGADVRLHGRGGRGTNFELL